MMNNFKFVSAHIDDYYKMQNIKIKDDNGLVIECIDGNHWKVVDYKKNDTKTLEIIKKFINSHPQAKADIFMDDKGNIKFVPKEGAFKNKEVDITTYEYLTGPHVSVIFRDAIVDKLK